MRILWLSWKDRAHPQAGGAEVVTHQLIKRLARDGHEVVLLASGFAGCIPRTQTDGYTIVRVGGRFSVYWQAYAFYRAQPEPFDLVVEEVNTIPFFAKWYARTPVVLFFHQLAREVWLYEMRPPFSWVGYLLEPIYLRLLAGPPTVTVSQSSKADLVRHGFSAEHISIISEGIEFDPLPSLPRKPDEATILSLGAIRSMKRVADIVRAYEIAKGALPRLKLVVAGGAQGAYGERVLSLIKRSCYASDIVYEGRVSPERKRDLLAQARAVIVASVKEGWCLVVTEANAMGTPAAVYNVDGLRDSVRDQKTGRIARQNTPQGLADALTALLSDKETYEATRLRAWEWSKLITFDKSYADFKLALKKLNL